MLSALYIHLVLRSSIFGLHFPHHPSPFFSRCDFSNHLHQLQYSVFVSLLGVDLLNCSFIHLVRPSLILTSFYSVPSLLSSLFS